MRVFLIKIDDRDICGQAVRRRVLLRRRPGRDAVRKVSPLLESCSSTAL
jgi:hypothetical protein